MMQPLEAVAKNGRLVVDEPTALPEGSEVERVPVDDDFDAEERARLLAVIDEGIEDFGLSVGGARRRRHTPSCDP